MATEPTYVTREELASSLDVKASAYMSAQLDRKCASATTAVHGLLNRKNLYPILRTRYLDWPTVEGTRPFRIYFDDDTLITLTSLVSGGVTIPTSAVNLEPSNEGPPYDYMELDRSQSYSFAGLQTPQRAIAPTGLWGFTNDEVQPSSLAVAVSSSSSSTVTVVAPVGGVGSLIRIDSERMIITDKTWALSGHTVGNVSGLTASNTDASLTVSDTSTYLAGETLLVDAERLQVREVVDATTLIVARAWDGTTLAVHANGATVRRQLTLQVTRGAVGTSASTHSISASVYRWMVPPLANELALAYAEDAFLQGTSGYARTVGQADNERPAFGRGIKDLQGRVIAAMGRQSRTRAV